MRPYLSDFSRLKAWDRMLLRVGISSSEPVEQWFVVKELRWNADKKGLYVIDSAVIVPTFANGFPNMDKQTTIRPHSIIADAIVVVTRNGKQIWP